MILGKLARLIRSKNAGPFMLTIDIIFENKENYNKVIESKNFNVKKIGQLYRINESEITLIKCEEINAIKISFKRLVSSGDLGDTDVFGGQQHGPLVSIEI